MRHPIRTGTALAALSILAAGAAVAHHSFAAVFDSNKPVRLVGTLTKVDWTNPHTYLHINVPDKNGNAVDWAVEAANPGALTYRGFHKSDVKLGDTLIVDGYLAKSGAKLIDGQRVTLPDGRMILGGSTGAGAPSGAAAAAAGE
jgi:hypothetical protein